jgi:hypothetical protein
MEEEGYSFYTALAEISIVKGILSFLTIAVCGYVLYISFSRENPQKSHFHIIFESLGLGLCFLGLAFGISIPLFFNYFSTLIKMFQMENYSFIDVYLFFTMLLIYFPIIIIIYVGAKILSKRSKKLMISNLWKVEK